MDNAIAIKIELEIIKRSTTIAAFEKKAGLNKGVIWSIINGRSKNPKQKTLEKIALAFNWSLEELTNFKSLTNPKVHGPLNSKLYMQCVKRIDDLINQSGKLDNAESTLKMAQLLYSYSDQSADLIDDLAKFIVNKY